MIITEPAVLAVTLTPNNQVLCNGGNSGSVTATVTGGTPAYTYVWDSGVVGESAETTFDGDGKLLLDFVGYTAASKLGVRVKVDKRDGVSNGFKYNDWELKGIPERKRLFAVVD